MDNESTNVAFPAEPEYTETVIVSSTRFLSFPPRVMVMSCEGVSSTSAIAKGEGILRHVDAGKSPRSVKLRRQRRGAVSCAGFAVTVTVMVIAPWASWHRRHPWSGRRTGSRRP